ncbi:MAG: flagellar basal body-associated FliL family protein [Methyloligellaceae bacterium]
MAEEDEELGEDVAEEDGEEKADEKKGGRGKLILYGAIGVGVLLFCVGGYAVISYFDPFGGSAAENEIAQPASYYDLPEMVVNLSSVDKRAQYLKIKIALEAKDRKSLTALNPVMPRILDMFQIYLRELRSSDLEGSAGVFRLKEELLRRVNLAIHPNRVDRILFKEIIIQ